METTAKDVARGGEEDDNDKDIDDEDDVEVTETWTRYQLKWGLNFLQEEQLQ